MTCQPTPHAPPTGHSQLSSSRLEIVLAEVDADRFERGEIDLLHIRRRRLEDHLELGVLVEAVRVLTIAAVGGAARGLGVGERDRLGAKHAEKGLRRHGAGADLNVKGLQQHAAALRPEGLQAEEQLLKGQWSGTGCRHGTQSLMGR